MSAISPPMPDLESVKTGRSALPISIELPADLLPESADPTGAGKTLDNVGVVAIGRNEGERLERALKAIVGRIPTIVYVDSGSTDGSCEMARKLGVHVVELDRSKGFTHAKGRNAGFEHIMQLRPDLEFVHFLDGDCEISEGWLDSAMAVLRQRPEVVWTCGKIIELYPDRSIYNRLRGLEWNWDTAGDVGASAGNGLARVSAIKAVGAFNGELIAGADWEICVRLRRNGGVIHRLDAEMCRHDSAMYSYRSWWKRNLRAGHVFAEGVWIHGKEKECFHVKPWRSNYIFGLIIPLLSIALAWPTHGWSLLGLLIHPLMMARVAMHARRRGYSWSDARLFGVFCILDKTPLAIGQLKFLWRVFRQRGHQLIEYH